MPTKEDINLLLVRLETEKNIILMFDILFEELDVKDVNGIKVFADAFIDMIFHIEEEMGKKESIFYYSGRLREIVMAINNNYNQDSVLKKMKAEMNPLIDTRG